MDLWALDRTVIASPRPLPPSPRDLGPRNASRSCSSRAPAASFARPGNRSLSLRAAGARVLASFDAVIALIGTVITVIGTVIAVTGTRDALRRHRTRRD